MPGGTGRRQGQGWFQRRDAPAHRGAAGSCGGGAEPGGTGRRQGQGWFQRRDAPVHRGAAGSCGGGAEPGGAGRGHQQGCQQRLYSSDCCPVERPRGGGGIPARRRGQMKGPTFPSSPLPDSFSRCT